MRIDKVGFDPTTSTLQALHATDCATSPLFTIFHLLGIEPTTFLQKKNALPLSYWPRRTKK